jgi:O-antigen/teichoic acid export membrane protein
MVLIITGFFLVVADIGVLGVALKVAAISQVILTGLNFVFRPMVAKLYAAQDFVTLKSIYRSITRWIFILTLPLSFLFIFYPSAVLGLFGERFSSGAAALTIIAIGYLFEYGTSATQVIINMTGKSWLSLMNQLLSFAAIFVGALFLIPRMGMNGAAVAVAMGIILVNLLRLWQSYGIVGFTPFSFYLFKPIAALLISGIFIFILFPPIGHYHAIQLFYLILTMLAIYSVIILLLGLNSEDRDLLKAAKSKLFS